MPARIAITPAQIRIRDATLLDIDRLAHIWHAGWHEAHSAILPVKLGKSRTLRRLAERLQTLLGQTRVAAASGDLFGFCIVRDDELYQIYVDAAARGCGVAEMLIGDAEQKMAAAGFRRVWLACAIGNERAARFYEKHGWQRAGPTVIHTETDEGPFELQVWCYEKVLPAAQ